MQNKNLVISTKTILALLFFLAIAWFFYSIFSVLLYIFAATIIALGLEPFVEKLI